MIQLIPATAGTATSEPFALYPEHLPATLQIYGGSGTDSAKLQRSYDGGNSFEDYYIDGALVAVTEALTNIKAIDAAGIFRVVKTTGGDAGVVLSLARDL